MSGAKPASAAGLVRPPNNLGLVAYYSFEDATSTKATDFSGRGNVGTLTNMEAASDWVSGKRGKALAFDGTDEHVDLGSTSLVNPLSDYSVSAWILTSVNNSTQMIFSQSRAASGLPRLLMFVTDSTVSFYMRPDSGSVEGPDASTNVADGKWHHVVFTNNVSSPAQTIYVDGVQDGQTTATITGTFTLDTVTIGVRKTVSNQNFFNGKVDEVRIYNRALGPTEVAALYNSGATKVTTSQNNLLTSGLVGLWSFNKEDLSGTTAYDRSGQGSNGTLTGGPSTAIGKHGQALSFDGSDDYVDTGALTLSSAVTFCAWIKPGNLPGAYKFFLGSDNAVGNSGIGIANDSSNHFYVAIKDGYRNMNGSSAFTVGAWYHICGAGSTSSGTPDMYVNGVLQSGTSGAISGGTNGGNLYIGTTPRASLNANATIDEVRIYNRALSAAEVTRLYHGSVNYIDKSQNIITPSSLVGWWTFDGPDLNTTTASDRSGQGNGGTLTGASGAQNKPQPVRGKTGQALYFDGTDDYVTMGDPTALKISSSYTLVAWVKPASMESYDPVINKRGESEGPYAMSLRQGGTLNCRIEDGGSTFNSSYDASISNGIWAHIACVFDDAANKLYFYSNGVQLGSTDITFAPNSSNTNAVMIGHNDGATQNGSSNYFHGAIDDARVYNRALSAVEMLSLYNQGK